MSKLLQFDKKNTFIFVENIYGVIA